MDFIRPSTMWFGNRCYRVLNTVSYQNTTNYMEEDSYGFESSVYEDEVQCGGEETEVQIEQLDNGKYQTNVAVANTYFPYIIGSKGATKKRIESETYTQIRIPAKGQSGDIVITGKDPKTVRQAKIKVDVLVEHARRKMPFTHFLSLPLHSPSVQQRFLEFKKEVLEKCGTARGVDETIFQDPLKLHLTLCVLILADERERRQAVEVLNGCSEVFKKYLSGEKLKVEIKGIEYMNDDPEEVDVLYGQVNALSWNCNLQALADSLVDEFVKSGVADRQYEKVKLHLTLMNTLFRQDKDGVTDSKASKDRESFSARDILEEFKDYSFGEMEVEELHLSVRYSTANNGFYSASGKIRLEADNSL